MLTLDLIRLLGHGEQQYDLPLPDINTVNFFYMLAKQQQMGYSAILQV